MSGFMYERVSNALRHAKPGDEAEAVFFALRKPSREVIDAGNKAIISGNDAKGIWNAMWREAFGDDEMQDAE